MKKIAYITGITGQDGAWLSRFLLEKDYIVYGLIRRSSKSTTQYIEKIIPDIELLEGDLTDYGSIYRHLRLIRPDEVYHLGAQSHVRISFEEPKHTLDVNAGGTINLLEATRIVGIDTKFYNAATCLVAGTKILIPKSAKRSRLGGIVHNTTSIGTKNIEDIKIDDQVLTFNIETSKKEYCKVLGIGNRIALDMYRVTLENGTIIELSGNHPIFIVGKNWVKTSKLKIGDLVIQKNCGLLVNLCRKDKSNIQIYGKQKAYELSIKNSKGHKGLPCKNGLKGTTMLQAYGKEKYDKIKEKASRSHRGQKAWNKNKKWSKKVRNKISKAQKTIWSKPEHSVKMMKLFKKVYNKQERKFDLFLNKICPDEFKYTGDGRILNIEGKLPDFICLNRKKIIEYNGDYWHTKHESLEREKFFKKRGWEVLTIWASEFLKNPNLVEKKVLTYLYNPAIKINKIVEIEKIDSAKVYNIEVEKNHNFFANCILVHNSELYGEALEVPQTEKTPFNPISPYAWAKQYAYNATVGYRKSYRLFACNGILFNHESIYRGLNFVTRKITSGVAKIKLGLINKLELGNLESKRDWGSARDYVEAMYLMLQQLEPEDYVIATGQAHTVREFCQLAFGILGLDYKNYVVTNDKFLRPSEVNILLGNSKKAREKLGWHPKISFEQMIAEMVYNDLELLKENNGV